MVNAKDKKRNNEFCFLDYSKAFNMALLERLWADMKRIGIPSYIIQSIGMHDNQTAELCTRHGEAEWFKIENT